MIIGLSLFATALISSGGTAPAVSADDVVTSRAFIQALATGAAGARKYATDDALLVVGDIGWKLAEALDAKPNMFPLLSTCHVGETHRQPVESAASLEQMMWRTGGSMEGKLSSVEGTMICPSRDVPNTQRTNNFSVILLGGQVVALSLQGQR